MLRSTKTHITIAIVLLMPTITKAQLQYLPYVTIVGMKVCGIEAHDNWGAFATKTITTAAIAVAVTYTLKENIHEWRPDNSDHHSLPSGHAAMAFSGATLLQHEYGHISPWISIGGYAYATGVAVERVIANRHYAHDVMAGAAIGWAAGELSFWLANKLFPKEEISVSLTPQQMNICYAF